MDGRLPRAAAQPKVNGSYRQRSKGKYPHPVTTYANLKMVNKGHAGSFTHLILTDLLMEIKKLLAAGK